MCQSYRAHRHLADRVLDDGKLETSQNIVSYYPVNHMLLDLADEGIHVWWDEGQIMKVINLKKQPKN